MRLWVKTPSKTLIPLAHEHYAFAESFIIQNR